jgi:hypothetical protein
MAFTGEKSILKLLHRNYHKGLSSFHETGESFKFTYSGIIADPLLRERTSLIASRLHESGIITQMYKKTYELDLPKQTPPEIGPQILTLDHLKAGFVICFVLLTISLVVFAAEFMPKLSRKLFHHLLPAYIVVKFMNPQKKQQKKYRNQNRRKRTEKPKKPMKKQNKKAVKEIKFQECSDQLKVEEVVGKSWRN